MHNYLKYLPAVFTPEQVQEMQEEMDRSAVPEEGEEARSNRAYDIIHRMSARLGKSAQAEVGRPLAK